ncbi:hypothetical protein COOONC_14802 [Cooperia oncophora]
MERSAAFSREKPGTEKTFDQAKQFIEAELSLIGSSYEAEQMCQSLKDQRRQLGRKKARLLIQRERYVSLEEPLKKRRSTEEGSALSAEDCEALRKIDEDLEKIDHQQMLCSDELNKLQRGCGSIDVDSRAESRWKDLLTLSSARVYLKALFEQKDHDEELGMLKEKHRKILMEYENQRAHAEMQYMNLVTLVSTSKVIDSTAVEEMKKLHDDIERMREIKGDLKKPKRRTAFFALFCSCSSFFRLALGRSRSSSCMERMSPVTLTTEEERRTRSSRHVLRDRFGNVKNPIKEVEPGSEEDDSMLDVSSIHARRTTSRKRRTRVVYNAMDQTFVVSESVGSSECGDSRSAVSEVSEQCVTTVMWGILREELPWCPGLFLISMSHLVLYHRPEALTCRLRLLYINGYRQPEVLSGLDTPGNYSSLLGEGLVVIDELHMVYDSSRGSVLESLCAKIMLWNSRLAQFKKRMNEMKKLEKQKQQSEEMQKRMQAEIAALKQAKVRMVKQQKEEAEKYRQWKLKHDRELIQVKQKERKRDFEAAREKRAHDQQMLVCKQKLEEAKNVNKRLLAQMERSAAFSREKPGTEKTFDQAKQFIEAELSLIGSSYEAEQMCQSLKDQRRQLGRKKARLLIQRERYVSLEEPLKKRRSTEEGSALSAEDCEALRKD